MLSKLYLKCRDVLNRFRIFYFKAIYGQKLSLKTYKCRLGRKVDFRIENQGQIILEDNVNIRDHCSFTVSNSQITIGSNTFFNRNCILACHTSIDIGENCMFGPNVSVYDHDHKYDNQMIPIINQGFNSSGISIGSNIWFGANTVITSGVKIGDNVIVGANSVVTRDLESNWLYAGVPARKIRQIYQ